IPEGVAISPVARARVAESGVDVAGITGSGRGGRLTAQDVAQAVRPEAEPALAGPYQQSSYYSAYDTPMPRRPYGLLAITTTGLSAPGHDRKAETGGKE